VNAIEPHKRSEEKTARADEIGRGVQQWGGNETMAKSAKNVSQNRENRDKGAELSLVKRRLETQMKTLSRKEKRGPMKNAIEQRSSSATQTHRRKSENKLKPFYLQPIAIEG